MDEKTEAISIVYHITKSSHPNHYFPETFYRASLEDLIGFEEEFDRSDYSFFYYNELSQDIIFIHLLRFNPK